MLTKSITLLLFFVSLSKVSAQWHFGVQAGGNLSTIQRKIVSSINQPDIKSKIFYFGGVYGEYMFAEKWSAGLDVQYAVRGSGYDMEYPSAIQTFRRKNLDLIPKVSFQILKNIDLQMGAYYSFLLEEAVQVTGSDTWVFPYYDFYSKTDVGLAPGLRFQFGRWSVQAQAQIGLKDLTDIEFVDENANIIGTTEKNRSFQLGIGYRIF